MPRARPLARTAFAALAFLAACAPARVPHAEPAQSADAYLGAAQLSDLVASRRGDRIAWLSDDRGEHQVWSAQGPDFAPKLVARWPGDDGRPLSELAIADDGARLAFVRGVEEGNAVNPTSDPRGPKKEVWVVDAGGASPPVLVGEGTSPVVRPDGAKVDFVTKGEVHRAPVDRAGDDVVFQARGKSSPPTWSPDGSRFAFVSDRGDHSLVGVFDPSAARITWMAPSVDRDFSPVWSPDGRRIAFLRFRGWRSEEPIDVEVFAPRSPVSVLVADATTGEAHVVVPEDANGGFAQTFTSTPLLWAGDGHLVFTAERDGWVRLWAASEGGTGEPVALTPAGCEADSPSLAPDRMTLVVVTNCDDSERRHLVSISFAEGHASNRLSQGQGIEWAPVVTTSGAVAYVGSQARDVPVVTIMPRTGSPRRLGPDAAARHMPPFVDPQPVTFRAADATEIHAELLLPPPAARAPKMPAIVFVHGGPPRQMLAGWHPMGFYHSAYEINQYLASRGYAVLVVNYRLGVGYGRAFRRPAAAGPLGSSEYQDVVAAARWLGQQGNVDAARIGIWGGSYGGLLTALALARDSATFRAGVDLCGVHDWSQVLHDELHGEGEQRVARDASPVASVATWTSPVLFAHGDDDHSVPFSQTTDLVQRLRDAGKAHVELVVFPDEQHGYEIHAHWVAVTERARDFFDRYLR